VADPRRCSALLGVALGAAALLHPAECGGAVRALSVTPSTLGVGLFPGGARVRVTGRVPVGSDAVIVVRGAEVRETVSRKTRVGIIWITGGKVEVSGAPAMFLSIAPRPLAEILAAEVIERHLLAERAFVARLRVAPPDADRPEIREAYLRLKVDDGSYRSLTGGFDLGPAVDGEVPFAVDLPWPATAPPGAYRVLAYECRDRAVVASASASLEIKESGFAAWLKHLAEARPGLYGLLAVGITLSVGFGLDLTLAWNRRRRRRGPPARVARAAREDVEVH
jgi:hypothetical protein